MTIDGILEYFESGNDDQRRLAAEVRRLRGDNETHDRLIEMQHKRVQKLQALHKRNKDEKYFIFDLGDLAEWATDEITRLRERERIMLSSLNYIACLDSDAIVKNNDPRYLMELAVSNSRAALKAVKE